MPKLWNTTIESHRRDVRDAVLDATAALADEYGLLGVTMSAVAAQAGVGRATLYKYFPGVEAILLAWHERQVGEQIRQLAAVRDRPGSAGERLEAVLLAYALIEHEQHGGDIAPRLHRGGHVARAHDHLQDFVSDLIAQAAADGEARTDVSPAELAAYCIGGVNAATGLPSKAASRRLVGIVLDGLRA